MGKNDYSTSEVMELETAPINISSQFDGRRHYNFARGISYTNPHDPDVEAGDENGNNTVDKFSDVYRHRDILGRVTLRPKDLLRYIDPLDGKPRRMIVQGTPEVIADGTGEWRRVPVKGDPPVILKLSTWCLTALLHRTKGQKYTAEEIAITVAKVLAVAPLQMILVILPIGTDGSVHFFYTGFPARSWEYPLYARNQFDARPVATAQTTWRNSRLVENDSTFEREHARRLKPRLLVVRRGERWSIEENLSDLPYLFISFTRVHFDPDPKKGKDCQPLYRKAAELTIAANLNAYWLDHLCIGQDGEQQMSDDIHTICDIVRGARQVIVVVKNLLPESLTKWGARMWTLTEALLSSNELIKFVSIDGQVIEKSRVSLANDIWNQDQKARMLAEHFSNQLTLSRLELISIAIQALDERQTSVHFAGDLAYSLAGLLGHRPVANPNDNLFQALARLSLANDSDRIVERMMCMLPDPPIEDRRFHNRDFVLDDKYGASLWDIEPLCQVAGVCEGKAVILDGCRGASIQWDKIPKVVYTHRKTPKRQAITMGLRSGPLPFLIGLVLTFQPGGLKAAGVILLLVGLGLILAAPWTIVAIYGGKVWGAEKLLIGFEGVMPIREIERITFGNAIGRLSYAPASSILSEKAEDERLGKEPAWIADHRGFPPNMPAGHRVFTLIDTGHLSVTVFTAERPPSVALVAGREGGMLRVVLCSYERSTASLHRETVIRMGTPMLSQVELLGWIKVE